MVEDWQRPITTNGLLVGDPAGSLTCDLGDYLEHSDGTLEALPAEHRYGHHVVYLHPKDGATVASTGWDGPTTSLTVPTPVPVRRLGGPWFAVLQDAPQPAPRYTLIVAGRQRPTTPPYGGPHAQP